MMLKPGTYLQDRYEILSLIGTGGMSEVYQAKCHTLNRLVAIKVLKDEYSQDANFVSKFKMEAQAAAGLSHPNIVSVYDVVDEGSLHYIVMELIEGITLKSYILKKGHLGVKETIGIAIQVAQGLAAAHDQHIVHRDIKPQNMIISRDGKVKVADFGIARAVSSQTIGVNAVGSVHYISPEQAKGNYSDGRSDLYSLGITMYEMLTGKLPFDGDTPVSEEPVQPPSRINPEVSASLDRIILKCTQKKPERRYQNAYELIADLRHALVDPNDDFLKKEPEFDENSPTVVRGAEELNRQMEAQRNRNLEQTMEHPAVSEKTGPVPTENERGEVVWKEPEQPEKEIEGWQEEETDVYEEETSRRPDRRRKGRRIEEDSEDVNPQMERLLTMIGIGAAVLIVVVVIVIVAKLTGIFNLGSGSQKSPKTTIEASSEASESESLESTECKVPSLDGMTEDGAKTALEKQSLKIRYEYAKSETSEKGKVIGQSIASGTVVSKQTEVIVTIGEGNEAIDLTKLGLEEMSGEDAETLLAEENKLTVVVQKESSDTVASGIVIRYSPSSVDPGGTVTLYVSTGPNVPTVPMPRITGLSEENAKVVLEAVGLELGERKEAKSSEVAKGKIISQDILEKTDTPEGSAIGYTVSLGKGTRYVAAINDEFQMSELFGPSSGDTHIRVSIVMKQTIAGNTVTKTVMEPREIGGDITLPIHYNIEGADGVQTGELQILDLTNDRVLKTYQLEFVEVSDN
mgnify:CR=1 FL=1